ncbi:MAG: YabP/YqfC family sporulation protein [Bacilli bacterium]
MSIVKRARNYLLDEMFNMRVLKNKIDICNYETIGYLDNDLIIINYDSGEIKIKGENLVVSKLLNDEILISGEIKNIEMR